MPGAVRWSGTGKTLTCCGCGKQVEPTSPAQKYCTLVCRKEMNVARDKAAIKLCHQRNPVSSILRTLRHRAKRKGRQFNLTKEDIIIPEVCPVFGFPLQHNFGAHGGAYNSPSVDRVDNTKGM